MKVFIWMAAVAVVAGLATPWLRNRGEDFLRDSFDTALPSQVEAHPWAPVENGKPQRAARVRFNGGTLMTTLCHAALGTYTVHVDHAFSFTMAGPVRPGCPGRSLQKRLVRATRVVVEKNGRMQRLVFTDEDDHTVAQLQGRGA